jgi:hypothetical protein
MNKSIINSAIFIAILFLSASCSSGKSSKNHNNKYLVNVTDERVCSGKEIASLIYDELKGERPDIKTNDVRLISITYSTTAPDGKPTIASGVIAMPENAKEYKNLLSVQHGTMDIDKAPSTSHGCGSILPAAYGRTVVMADYLGYGASRTDKLETPYLHIKYTGTACADMIEAAKEYLAKSGIKALNDSIELIGYSQGGTSTIATLYELERRGNDSKIMDVRSGGGMYDLYDTFEAARAMGMTKTSNPCFIPYIIRGMEYGENITLDKSKIYAPETLCKTELFETTQLST